MNDEAVCGLKNSYIEAYLGAKEASRFISKQGGSERRGAGFNPFAFLFSFLWLFHKKLYKEFVVFTAVFLTLPFIVGSIAGISRIEGNITPKAVCSELREAPLVLVYYPCRCTEHRFENLVKTMPWYKIMLLPVIEPDYYGLEVNSVPAFYFGLFRVLTMLALNIFLGLYGNALYLKGVRLKILRQLADISTDEDGSRLRILSKAGAENSSAQYKFAPLLALVCVITPFIYDAVRIIYG